MMSASEPPNIYEYLDPVVPMPVMPPVCADHCVHCKGTFWKGWRWRHHCRNCGASVCSSCSDMMLVENPDSRRCARKYDLACARMRAAFMQIRLQERMENKQN